MEIKPYSNNAKKHPDKQLKLIAGSIKELIKKWGKRKTVAPDGKILMY